LLKSIIPNLDLVSIVCSGTAGPGLIGNILESISDSVIVLGPQGDILCCNRITEEMLGYSPEELLEKGLAQLMAQRNGNEEFNRIFIETISKQSVSGYKEVDYHHPDGSVRRLAATTSYLVDIGERQTSFTGFVALFKDITEVADLRRKERQLIQERHKIAGEKIRSLQKLAMGVAHEIRNPIVTVGGFAARIARAADDPEATRRYANNIMEAAKSLEKAVDAVQQCCDLPAINPFEGSLSDLLRMTVSEMAPKAQEKKVNLRVHDELPRDYKTSFDPLLLRMALVRLIENSVEFSREGSPVDITLRTLESGTLMEVKDHGNGISEQDAEYIFNPFFSTLPHAAGMGLVVVESVVNDHSGTIEVDSKPGVGTSIRICLPRSLQNVGTSGQ
jgi:PAS domain S-box-containing protein